MDLSPTVKYFISLEPHVFVVHAMTVIDGKITSAKITIVRHQHAINVKLDMLNQLEDLTVQNVTASMVMLQMGFYASLEM